MKHLDPVIDRVSAIAHQQYAAESLLGKRRLPSAMKSFERTVCPQGVLKRFNKAYVVESETELDAQRADHSTLSNDAMNQSRRDIPRPYSQQLKRPLRVAMVADSLITVPPKGYGGTEQVIATLAEGLVRRNHDVVVFTTRDSTVRAPMESFFETAAWPSKPYRQDAHLVLTMQKIREAGFFDLIHVHSAPASAMASPLGMPLVYTSHWPESHSIGELFEALRAANSHFQLVAVSKRHSEILGKRYQPKVIYHGIDEGKFSLGSGRRRYAAFLGRFMKEKGVHIAIDVALQSRIPIRLAGVPIHDSDHRYYDREVKPRLSHRLATLVGEVGGKTKNGFLSHAIALLLPVNIEEAFGLVLVEAMLCGTPAIAFRRGAIPEIIDEGVTGWVVDTPKQMSDRLVQLSTDTDFDHERCRERAIERFSSARMVNNYIDLYRSILRRKS